MRSSEALSPINDSLKDFAKRITEMSVADLRDLEIRLEDEAKRTASLGSSEQRDIDKFRSELLDFRMRQVGLIRQEIKKREES